MNNTQLNRTLDDFMAKKVKSDQENLRVEELEIASEARKRWNIETFSDEEFLNLMIKKSVSVRDVKSMLFTERKLNAKNRLNRDEEKHWSRINFSAAENVRKKLVLSSMSKANAVESYKTWLRGFLERGGRLTNSYNYPMPSVFFVAKEDFVMIPLYGSSSINVIVPANIHFLGGSLGHSGLFLTDKFEVVGGTGRVPIYSDIRF
ncbi:MAG: hypothetical protein HYY55_02925 [Candidatus Niyogibacteria bacterium]|nr:MAG: hypothetical protein HYY55_02925 [Candidatus Niyogibacteria bacterium]